MQEKVPQEAPQTVVQPRLVTDRVIAPMIGLSVSFLQKDRRGQKRIPYIPMGHRCLYDVDEALAAVKALTVGGPRGRRCRIGSGR